MRAKGNNFYLGRKGKTVVEEEEEKKNKGFLTFVCNVGIFQMRNVICYNYIWLKSYFVWLLLFGFLQGFFDSWFVKRK